MNLPCQQFYINLEETCLYIKHSYAPQVHAADPEANSDNIVHGGRVLSVT